MYFKTEIRIEPKEGRNLPSAEVVGSDLFDILADVTRQSAYDFTVTGMSVSQQPESEDEFRSAPESLAVLAPGELDLLRTYAAGPRMWDATAVLPRVFSLASKGLIKPVPDRGPGFRLTAEGRRVLDQEGSS